MTVINYEHLITFDFLFLVLQDIVNSGECCMYKPLNKILKIVSLETVYCSTVFKKVLIQIFLQLCFIYYLVLYL